METNFPATYVHIKKFVDDLWEVYGEDDKITALTLYYSFLEKIQPSHTMAITKVVNGFKAFFEKTERALVRRRWFEVKEKIYYSPKTYLDVPYFVNKADTETKECIRNHLLTVLYSIYPERKKAPEPQSPQSRDQQTEQALSDLKVDTSTPEGEFFTSIMNRTKNVMEEETVDTSSPMSAMMSLVQSGLVQDLMTGLQDGVESGKLDGNRLLTTMHSALGAMIQKNNVSEVSPTPANETVTTSSSSSDASADVSDETCKEVD